MVVDASAILAIILKEEDGFAFREALSKSRRSVMSPVNYWEVLVRAQTLRGVEGAATVETTLHEFDIDLVTIDAQMARDAAQAFAKFGRRSAGGLNLGDCFAYALAQSEDDGLLYKGNDFPKTDVKSVL